MHITASGNHGNCIKRNQPRAINRAFALRLVARRQRLLSMTPPVLLHEYNKIRMHLNPDKIMIIKYNLMIVKWDTTGFGFCYLKIPNELNPVYKND